MVFYSKCENSIKGVLLLTPFMLALVNIFWFKRNVGEIIIVFALSISISLFIMIFMISTRYIIEEECLLIVGIFRRKKILYQNIDQVLKKDGKVSLEAPSIQQLWVMKGDKVLAQLSPTKMEECEKRLNQQMMAWRLKNSK